MNLAAKNDFIKGVVRWVDLRCVTVEERLDHFSSNEIKGFREIVQGEADDFILRKDVQSGIRALKQFNFSYDILIFHRQLPAAISLVNQFADQFFVIDYIARPDIKSGDILSKCLV